MDEFTKAAKVLYDLAREDVSPSDSTVQGIAAGIRSAYERGKADQREQMLMPKMGHGHTGACQPGCTCDRAKAASAKDGEAKKGMQVGASDFTPARCHPHHQAHKGGLCLACSARAQQAEAKDAKE